MIIDDNLDQAITQLFSRNEATIATRLGVLQVSLSEDMNTISMKIPVFKDESYIPKSIRRAINADAIFPQTYLSTSFVVDEGSFSVLLYASANIEQSGFQDLENFLKDFVWEADEWFRILEKYGKEDLVFVYVRKPA
jgi:hypothetical protein